MRSRRKKARSVRVALRCHDRERGLWDRAAELQERDMSDWIRRALNREAEREIKNHDKDGSETT